MKLIYTAPKITSIAYIIAGNAGTHANAPQKTQPSSQRINVIQNFVLNSPWCRYTASGGNKIHKTANTQSGVLLDPPLSLSLKE